MTSHPKMPHNNRMSSSTALRTNDIWSKTIGYDPYASSMEAKNDQESEAQKASLMLLARMSNLSGSESRGGCKKCGMLGHLSFQCRNAPLNANPSAAADSDSSSSSEEDVAPKPKRPAQLDPKDGEKDRRKRRRSDSSSSSSSEDSEDERKKKRSKKSSKKSKKHKKEHKRKEHKKERKAADSHSKR